MTVHDTVGRPDSASALLLEEPLRYHILFGTTPFHSVLIAITVEHDLCTIDTVGQVRK